MNDYVPTNRRPGENGLISISVQATKTESWWNRKSEMTNYY